MSSNETLAEVVPAEQQLEIRAKQAPRPLKKLRPARKQVKPGDVVKTETVQTGKEYSMCLPVVMNKSGLNNNDCRYLVQQMGRWRPRRQLLKVRLLDSI